MQSTRFEWDSADTIGFLKKALIQTVPVVLIYISFVVGRVQGGFKWSDFIPTLEMQGVIVLYLLNRIYDALQRFVGN